MEAARLLGAGFWRRVREVALPLSRPALVAGVALALMETLADYGVGAYFGLTTLSTGIYKAWLVMNDRVAAAQTRFGAADRGGRLAARVERRARSSLRFAATRIAATDGREAPAGGAARPARTAGLAAVRAAGGARLRPAGAAAGAPAMARGDVRRSAACPGRASRSGAPTSFQLAATRRVAGRGAGLGAGLRGARDLATRPANARARGGRHARLARLCRARRRDRDRHPVAARHAAVAMARPAADRTGHRHGGRPAVCLSGPLLGRRAANGGGGLHAPAAKPGRQRAHPRRVARPPARADSRAAAQAARCSWRCCWSSST